MTDVVELHANIQHTQFLCYTAQYSLYTAIILDAYRQKTVDTVLSTW